jgi:hypothetical protein
LVSVTCFPSDVLMVCRLSYFRIAGQTRQMEQLLHRERLFDLSRTSFELLHGLLGFRS